MTTVAGVVQKIQFAIMTGDFMPRQRLVESELALTYSVGRSVIRESLRILEDRGAVISHSNKGASVADFTPKQIRDLYLLRTRLERLAGILAFERITENDIREMEDLQAQLHKSEKTDIETVQIHEGFHEIIYKASGDDILTREIRRLIFLSGPVRYRAYISHDLRSTTVGQHDEIIQSLRNGQKQLFLDLNHSHVFESLKAYLHTFHPTEAEQLVDGFLQLAAISF